jgi:hypothetical protein
MAFSLLLIVHPATVWSYVAGNLWSKEYYDFVKVLIAVIRNYSLIRSQRKE